MMSLAQERVGKQMATTLSPSFRGPRRMVASYASGNCSATLLLSDPKAIQHVLATNANNYPRDPKINLLLADLMLGVGILSAEGALHVKYRKFFSPLFTASAVKSYLTIFESQTLAACDRLVQNTRDHPSLNMLPVLRQLTLNIIGLAMCGLNFEDHPQAAATYKHYAGVPGKFILIGLVAIPGFMRLPLPAIRRRRQAQQALRRLISDIIDAKLMKDTTTEKNDKQVDFLDLILRESTVDEAIAHTMTVLFAGHDTASGVLSWTLATLATQPRVVALLRAEHKAVADHHHGSLGTAEAVGELTYTLAVIQESMRLNTVTEGITPRIALQADRIPTCDGSSFDAPKGTQMLVKFGALHRNPKYWACPDEFIPERFVEHSAEWNADLALRHGQSHAFYYMPFSAGVMNCIGYRFALAEMQIIIATLVSRFDFELTADADLRHSFTGGALHPKMLDMHVRPRRRSSA
ncbi:Aste57867_9898 [Aphanomyces stellatus]|uniref:Aste57867_9898 protein n=1 Tax=Aphanomyces stellatus TaxID=120398 RepID=A0A485KPR2_9STRA|nr:hypothetical protein As57867_009859 [Aphanomyces stellatus]VFT86777.1 Aste57867_9898 [Aphanomyces stellatus]